jgi:hypothetical protein
MVRATPIAPQPVATLGGRPTRRAGSGCSAPMFVLPWRWLARLMPWVAQ